MQIKVNKDFLHEYKNEFWKGFTIPELVSIAVGLGCDGVIVYIAWKYFQIAPDNAVYLGMPAMVPALVVGFVKFQDNANLIDYAKAIYDTYKCKELSFSGETKRPRGHFFYMYHKGRKGAKKR